MKLISLECPGCKANLELDPENLIAYCPYCGKKLLFDLNQVEEILYQKEKTKQIKIIKDSEIEKIKLINKKNKDDNKHEIWTIILFVFGPFLVIIISVILFVLWFNT